MQVTTVACKLKVPSKVAREIDATLEAFAAACTWINANTPLKLTNRTAIALTNPMQTETAQK